MWDVYLRRQQVYLPVFSDSDGFASSKLSTCQLEALVRATQRTAGFWSLERPRKPFYLEEKTGNTLLGLQIFLDRWLLVVYSEGIIHLWDILGGSDPGRGSKIGSEPKKLPTLDLGSKRWTSYTACLDSSKQKIFLAFTRALPYVQSYGYESTLMSLQALLN